MSWASVVEGEQRVGAQTDPCQHVVNDVLLQSPLPQELTYDDGELLGSLLVDPGAIDYEGFHEEEEEHAFIKKTGVWAEDRDSTCGDVMYRVTDSSEAPSENSEQPDMAYPSEYSDGCGGSLDDD
jgi:hypothetical protein